MGRKGAGSKTVSTALLPTCRACCNSDCSGPSACSSCLWRLVARRYPRQRVDRGPDRRRRGNPLEECVSALNWNKFFCYSYSSSIETRGTFRPPMRVNQVGPSALGGWTRTILNSGCSASHLSRCASASQLSLPKITYCWVISRTCKIKGHVQTDYACLAKSMPDLLNNGIPSRPDRLIKLGAKYDAALTRTNSVQGTNNRELFQIFKRQSHALSGLSVNGVGHGWGLWVLVCGPDRPRFGQPPTHSAAPG
jgi:hypothetical protein